LGKMEAEHFIQTMYDGLSREFVRIFPRLEICRNLLLHYLLDQP